MDDQQTIDDIKQRLRGERVAMLTTVDERGTLSGRPLTIQTFNDFGDVFFLVSRDAEWVDVGATDAANVSIVDDGATWLSIAGRLHFVTEEKLLDELWDDHAAGWFPNGKADAVVAHLQSDRWEYWTAPTAAVQVFEFAKAKLTGDPMDAGSSGAIET